MDAYGPRVPGNVDEGEALSGLLAAFGSSFSLEQIASVYCKAKKDADAAGLMLIDMQGCDSLSTTDVVERNVEGDKDLRSGDFADQSSQANGVARSSNLKLRPVSAGTVSSVIGKEYINPRPSVYASNAAAKPLSVNSRVLPITEAESLVEDSTVDDNKQARLRQDMEDFLFTMLGDGFQLERDVIREVLGKCGYDMQKSMEQLFDLSATGAKRGYNHHGRATKLHDPYSGQKNRPQESTNDTDYSGRFAHANGADNHRGRETLQNEVLHALYHNSEPQEELTSQSPGKVAKRSKGFGEVVLEPYGDFVQDAKSSGADADTDAQETSNEDDEDDGYRVLRQAVQEYRGTMKEYYRAATDAFAKGDSARANKLLDQGHLFCKRARDADEESYKKIFDVRKKKEQDDMLLDLHEQDAKDSIRLLKCHITNLAGTPSFAYLKVVIAANGKDNLKGARRRSVVKFLEKYCIKWVEDASPGTILIPLADVEPSVFRKK